MFIYVLLGTCVFTNSPARLQSLDELSKNAVEQMDHVLSLIHISEPTRH